MSDAVETLLKLLPDDAMIGSEIYNIFENSGFSHRTVERSKKDSGVISVKKLNGLNPVTNTIMIKSKINATKTLAH
ncbi:hypothetical protein FACS189499_04650 [Clostridia bacterium]|nr:hypothetical protein FACS189499_04650 [Clostridia bacterium]